MGSHSSGLEEVEGALTMVDQQPAQDMITRDPCSFTVSEEQGKLMTDSILVSCWKLRNLLLCPPALFTVSKTEPGACLPTAAEMLTKRCAGGQMNLCLLQALPGIGKPSPNESAWLRSEHEASRCTFGGLGLSAQSECHAKL